MKKRLLSIVLTLCMVTQLMPTAALAAQVEAASNALASNVAAVSNLGVDGDEGADERDLSDDQETPDEQGLSDDHPLTDSDGTNVDETPTSSTHTHRICGDASCSDDSHAEIEWTAWDSNNSLPSKTGNYYLTTDVTLSGTWVIWNSTPIKLCLNGYTITGADGADTIKLGTLDSTVASLDITDCHQDDAAGKITHNSGATGRAVDNYGVLTLWNGNITGNTGSSYSSGVAVDNAKTFNMYGGTISGNDGSQNCLGTVYNRVTFNMSGGSITNDLATHGAGVYNPKDSTFNMSGGSITDNECTWQGAGVLNYGTINLSGAVTIAGNKDGSGLSSNIYQQTGRPVSVASTLSSESCIGIGSARYNCDVVAGSTDTSIFTSDDPSYALEPNGSNLKLVVY